MFKFIQTAYDQRVLPSLINYTCSRKQFNAKRSLIVPRAYGRVLEVGFGSGLNLRYYDTNKIEKLWCLEPSQGMRNKAAAAVSQFALPLDWLGLPGEQIPLPDNSVDCIVITYTLCSIGDYQGALAQMYRVLKPGGQLLYCEHGLAPTPAVANLQKRLTPLWRRLAGGCHLDRPVLDLITRAGFVVSEHEQQFLQRMPSFIGSHYMGVATKQL